MRRLSIAILVLLQGCQPPPAPETRQETPAATSALERAALEAGIVSDASRVSPVGLYQRRHEAGRDSLCLIPASDRKYRFGLEAIFGTEQQCRGSGTARRVGDKLILHFSGRANCLVVAHYEGDRIALPGVLDMKCASLCSSRGSLEGVAFPRLSSEERAARAALDRGQDRLCPS